MNKILLGNLPVYNFGVNVGRLNRSEVSKITGFSKNEIKKAYLNWIKIFRIENSTLTFEDYLKKLKDANIRPTDVGLAIDSYNLSRYNDTGPYTKDSCRFILKKDNLNEQKKIPPFTLSALKYGMNEARQINSNNAKSRWK